ncbi:hypothetical protein C7974DRAFT_425202 [Boeremia exigua]|uniref:uncharacterized protein n=1 Tax=Boeremia exigua TaxID=749465 RepID=UPI001E8D2C80|nr:uncharacterized protein C7974DRAFT_425202 [Boeremia exigua]KAH6625564.1 hypothetical protein C7974DRAFT_425202 [Boeremia exigua]
MFAQLFGAARRAISRTPSYQGPSSDAAEQVPEIPTSDPAPLHPESAAMVTTRRGTETPGMSTPAGSAKKFVGKRELEALESPSQPKRQKTTVVEVTRKLRSTPRKGATEISDSASEIDEPTPKPKKTSPLARRRRSSPKVVVAPSSDAGDDAHTQDGFHTPEPASSEAAFVTPFTSKKALAGSHTPASAKNETPTVAKKARGRPKKAQKQDIPEEIPSSTQESSVASPPAPAHVRFGSEEPAAAPPAVPAPTPAPVEDEDEDSDSDSDAAPETVSASAAVRAAAAATADTTRALTAQAAKERAKADARAARLAAEQAAKRDREARKAEKAARHAAKAARLAVTADDVEDAMDSGEDERTPHTALPSLLPASLLANLSATRPPTPPPETPNTSAEAQHKAKLARHIKFLEQSSQAPKERRVGKHRVAVLGQRKGVLADKVGKGGRGVREGWLKGRDGTGKKGGKGKAVGGKGGQRAKFGGGGFLRGD